MMAITYQLKYCSECNTRNIYCNKGNIARGSGQEDNIAQGTAEYYIYYVHERKRYFNWFIV